MELRDVEAFLVLAEELHFGKTGRRLQLTQGRVSQMIRALEREVGGALFQRTSRQVSLTPLGEQFLAGARDAHGQLMATLSSCRLRARGIEEQVRIGYLPSIGLDFVARLISAFQTAHPSCEVVFRAVTVRFLYQPESPLSDPAVDLVLLWCPGGNGDVLEAPGYTVGPVLAKKPRALLVPADHSLAQYESVSLEDLTDEIFIDPGFTMNPAMSDLWTPRFTPSGRPIGRTPENLPTMAGTKEILVDDVLTLVLAGRGLHCTVASLLDRFPCPDLTVVPIRDMPPMIVTPVWRTAAENATIRAFVATASRASHYNTDQ